MKSARSLVAVALTLLITAARWSQELSNKAMEDFIGCPACGMHRSGKIPIGKELQLNLEKNRYLPPTTFDSTVTLEQMSKPGDDQNRWDPNTETGAKIRGYVVFIIQNFLGEACNCFKLDDAHSDTHIDLVMNSADAKDFSKHVIVEVTPRMKYLARKQGKDWSTAGLTRQYYHRCVNVEGWLLWDGEHEKQARNTNPTHPNKVWRATCWEIHPATSITVSSAAAPEQRRFQSTRS